MSIHTLTLLSPLALALFLQVSEGSQVTRDLFVRVGRVPRATIETMVPLPSVNYAHCASRCLAIPESCQGFHIINQPYYSCVLLEGLNGVSDSPDDNVKAFISTYFNGKRHYFSVRSVNFTNAITFCQSMGMVLASYPTQAEQRNWMNSFNENLMFIGALKDPSKPSQVYDINTNALVTVDWINNDPGMNARNVVVLLAESNKFDSSNDWYKWDHVGVMCSPAN